MNKIRMTLLSVLCCAVVSVCLSGCAGQHEDTKAGKGLSSEAKKSKKGDE